MPAVNLAVIKRLVPFVQQAFYVATLNHNCSIVTVPEEQSVAAWSQRGTINDWVHYRNTFGGVIKLMRTQEKHSVATLCQLSKLVLQFFFKAFRMSYWMVELLHGGLDSIFSWRYVSNHILRHLIHDSVDRFGWWTMTIYAFRHGTWWLWYIET